MFISSNEKRLMLLRIETLDATQDELVFNLNQGVKVENVIEQGHSHAI